MHTTLGVELVDALARYSSVLDVFDEVVSWREMVLSEQRTPLVRSEADTSRESMGRASILAILFKSEMEEEEQAEAELPEIFSSIVQMRSV